MGDQQQQSNAAAHPWPFTDRNIFDNNTGA